MDERTDGELLTAWVKGDQGAFTTLVERHQTVLLRHARALLGPGGAAEDVVQEAFVRLARRPPALAADSVGDGERETAQLRGWLHTVTRNAAMDMMRSDARRTRRESEVAPEEATGGGLDGVEAEDTREAVERGLDRLPPAQREVLVLRLVGERSYREIAEITGRKTGTVGWLISEGLKALSNELAHLCPATAGGEGGAL
ncbi:RNA polymerase sigma factor [Engelhardtia mirabilis]|uniref:ECF RNA polymerase sigma factor SigW n=1 Tax=Engelhardtia mirabilis TaxID=2528011 RepID=A0A518BSI5_9BACT|nr:ECF RNA polymerase sigma factor SigW [Planctomycetes bacterium Pla133]QDV04255.1 ECF RNA polymerase sigma factor SigW [Planctomycetes bacterium Pla86]